MASQETFKQTKASQSDDDNIVRIASPHVGGTGGLLSALRAINADYRCIPDAANPILATLFNLSRAEVRGVISFYHDFKSIPRGATIIRLCAAEACQAAGGRDFIAAVEKKFGLKMGETSASGDVTLEPVYCLGLCSTGPAAIVGECLVGMADAGKIEKAVDRAKAERAS